MTVEHAGGLALTGLVSFALSYFGAAAGLILGHLRLPLLVSILGNPVAAASTNLAVSGVGALAGSVGHVRGGRVSGRLLLVMGVPSVVGAVLAVRLFTAVDLVWSHFAIGLMLVFSGVGLVRSRNAKPDAGGGGLPDRWVVPVEGVVGLGLGALAAATGLMLGSMRLPLMIRYLRVDPKVAVGTNMLVGCLTAFAASGAAWVSARHSGGRVLDIDALLIVGPPTILGSWLGARAVGKLSAASLKGMVGWIVAFSGLFMVGQAGQKALRGPSTAPPGPTVAFPFDPAEEVPDWDEPDEPDEPRVEPQAEPQDRGEPGAGATG